MLLIAVDTFLCLDASKWTAVGTVALILATGALVWVTWRLWTTAQTQLKEQRRTAALLNKPFFLIKEIEQDWLPPDRTMYGFKFNIKNDGDGAAWRVVCIVRAIINESDTTDLVITRDRLGAGDFIRVEVPIDDGPRLLTTLPLIDIRVVFLVTIKFSDIEEPSNVIQYELHREKWDVWLSKLDGGEYQRV